MKHIPLLLFAAFFTVLFFACKKPEKQFAKSKFDPAANARTTTGEGTEVTFNVEV